MISFLTTESVFVVKLSRAGVASSSGAVGAMSNGRVAGCLLGLKRLREAAAGVLRPRVDVPDGGGGMRPFWKGQFIYILLSVGFIFYYATLDFFL